MMPIYLHRPATLLLLLLFTTLPSTAKESAIDQAASLETPPVENPVLEEKIDLTRINYPLLNTSLVEVLNDYRRTHSQAPFKASAKLTSAATAHTKAMVDHNFFSHQSPVQGAHTLGARLAKVGIYNTIAAENIANEFILDYTANTAVYPLKPTQGSSFKRFSYSPNGPEILTRSYAALAKHIIQKWHNSPGHKQNMLNKAFSHAGIGTQSYQDALGLSYVKVTLTLAQE